MHNNSTVALGIEILSTKYRGQLSNVFQLDFVTNRIHINMPRRSPYFFFSPCLASGYSKGTGQLNRSRQLFPGRLRGRIGNEISADIHEVVQTGSDSTIRVVLTAVTLALRFWIKLFVVTLFASASTCL